LPSPDDFVPFPVGYPHQFGGMNSMAISPSELIIILVILIIYVAVPTLLIVTTLLFYRRLKEIEQRLQSIEEKLNGKSDPKSAENS
jgi:hypothetical protein